ncbi:mycothiol synthase [Aeromicrobium sp. CF3.5]|uniref:mycothiol synthase n=1 Tax=Aeromicrobium sp. CF3.5 TaxID=3373078 RepID=UPI003EE4A61C
MTDLTRLAELVEAADGVAPFNEATLSADAADAAPRTLVQGEPLDGAVVQFLARGDADAPVELAVHPQARGAGLGRQVLTDLIDRGENQFWAHGDLPAAQRLAASVGLEAVRTLLVLRLTFDGAPSAERSLDGITIRAFSPDDGDAVIAVNGRAFASHPEQGAMDRADFDRRTALPWFDPAGLFVAERDGAIVGFHWTKIEDGIGEVYVVGVDPSEQGSGLGTALTARGLRHLHDVGVPVVDLYVEGDNAAALAVYRRLGFVDHARDTLYRRRDPLSGLPDLRVDQSAIINDIERDRASR